MSKSKHNNNNRQIILADPILGFDDCINKPDFKELDSASPVSTLQPRPSQLSSSHTTTTSSESDPSRVLVKKSSHSGSVNSFPKATTSSSESDPNRVLVKKSSHSGSVNSFPKATGSRPVKPVKNSVNSLQLSLLPAGNIVPSGKIIKTRMNKDTKLSHKSTVLGTGTGHYGHGSIMGSSIDTNSVSLGVVSKCSVNRRMESVDLEEVKRMGNEMFKRGNFKDALRLYDRVITWWPKSASFRTNRAHALSGLGRVIEAVRECQEGLKLDPEYHEAHWRLGSLFLRLGMVDIARKHLCFPGKKPEPAELQKLQNVEIHLMKCTNAREVCDWKRALCECDAAVAAGADSSPQLHACRAESLLKLQRLEDADASLSISLRYDLCAVSTSQSMSFGMLSAAYLHYVQAQIELSFGRFNSAVSAAEKAGQIDTHNAEVLQLLKNVKLVSRARNRGNNMFESERFTEACLAYGEGLRLDPFNSILYCNRAACWFKIGQLKRSIEDCNQALRFQPSYTKALLRRAVSYYKLEQWWDAVEDYKALRKALPNDNEVAKSLFYAQVALRKSIGEKIHDMKLFDEVDEVAGLEQYRSTISSPVYFRDNSNLECSEMHRLWTSSAINTIY